MAKYTIKDEDGNILTKKSEGYKEAFHDGYAVAELDGKVNFVDDKGNPLSDTDFLEATDFVGGISRVRTAEGYNFYTTGGSYLMDKFYQKLSLFIGDYAHGQNEDGSWTVLKKDGTPLTATTYKGVGIGTSGFTPVIKDDGLTYFLNDEGKEIGSGYREVRGFSSGLCTVRIDELKYETDAEGFTYEVSEPKYNAIHEDGTPLNSEEYDDVDYASNGYVRVRKGKLWYMLATTDGSYVTTEGFLYLDNFLGSTARVRKADGLWYLLSKETGETITSGYNRMTVKCGGFYRVWDGTVWNYLDEDGKTLLDIGVDEAGEFMHLNITIDEEEKEGVFARIKRDGQAYLIDTEGKEIGELEEEEEEEEPIVEEEAESAAQTSEETEEEQVITEEENVPETQAESLTEASTETEETTESSLTD